MTQRGWAVVTVAAAVVTAALTAVVARWAEGRYERDFAIRMATTTSAYLAVATPPARRGSADYDVRRLLTQARALRTLPIWTSQIEVYYGTAPLVDATGAPLSPDDLAQLRGGEAARWPDGVAVVPLWDREHREVVGAVAVRPRRIPGGAFPGGGPIGWALPAALVAVGVAAGAAFRRRPFRRYLLASAVLALAGYADVRSAARRSTDRWLADTRLLLQEAATRHAVPGSRVSLAELTPLTRGAELVPGDPAESAPRRFRVGGIPRAAIAVLIGPGRWVELRTVPLENFTTGWLALLFGCAFLGPLGVFAVRWAEQMDRRELRQAATAWTFLAPAGLHLVVFTAGPILFALYLSVHRWGLVEPIRPFVGLSNFAAGLRDPLVWIALRNAALYALYVPISAAIALAVALVLGGGGGRAGLRLGWGARLLRGMFFLPYVSSVVAMALVWQRIFQSGAIGGDLLRSPKTALLGLMVISIWAHVGYQMVVFLAGLERIPRAYLDAAQLDGAGAWRRFWRITFPLLRPVTLFVLVTGIIGAFQVFTYVYVLTGGGPLHATDVLVYRIYRIGFEFLQFGVASALSLLVFLLLLALTRGQVRLLGRVAEVEHA